VKEASIDLIFLLWKPCQVFVRLFSLSGISLLITWFVKHKNDGKWKRDVKKRKKKK
jgi:hypothetical protein